MGYINTLGCAVSAMGLFVFRGIVVGEEFDEEDVKGWDLRAGRVGYLGDRTVLG